MCDTCRKDSGVDVTLTGRKGWRRTLCPNHLVSELYQGRLIFEPDETLVCEVTGKAGAVYYEDEDEKYALNPDTMLRLINRSLRPSEYARLRSLRKGRTPFMLHDDFYDETTGAFLQPILKANELTALYKLPGGSWQKEEG